MWAGPLCTERIKRSLLYLQNGRQNQRWVFEYVQDSPPPYQENPNKKNPNQNQNNNGGVSSDPSLSIIDNDGNELSAANGNLNPNTIYVTNNSKTMVRVQITNNSNTGVPKELNNIVLQVGEYATWQRRGAEVLSVYRAPDNFSGNFATTPQTYNVSPGKITAIVWWATHYCSYDQLVVFFEYYPSNLLRTHKETMYNKLSILKWIYTWLFCEHNPHYNDFFINDWWHFSQGRRGRLSRSWPVGPVISFFHTHNINILSWIKFRVVT